MVVCNLYPFKEAVLKGADLESLVEEIDIGGPSLLRASGKNFKYITKYTNDSNSSYKN